MTTSITFSYGATTLTIRPADFEDRREVRRMQTRARTHDGALQVGDKGLTIVQFILTWDGLTDTVREQIEDFFSPTKVNGSLHDFTYIDHFGVSYDARLLDDGLSYINRFTNLWTVNMVFEVTESVVS